MKDKLALLGPGLLYAGAAVGVSHLVQSTRAGAEFGFQLLVIIVLINIIKYPLFEIGPRYAAATGKTLLDGYRKMGRWAVLVYILMSVSTMFIIISAISIVTAGLFAQLTSLSLEPAFISVIILAISVVILGVGHYSTLDKLMKVIVVLLSVSSLLALAFSFAEPIYKEPQFKQIFDLGERTHVLFLVALLGWMPAPIDISIWHSVWSVSKTRERGKRVDMKTALLDFKIGYWGTTMLAVCFLSLGAIIMYGTNEQVATGSVAFAEQLISLYTSNLGQWTFPFIALAAFTTMFSTMLTCLDAFPRTLRKASKLMIGELSKPQFHFQLYWIWLMITALGSCVILLFYLRDMRAMVDLATTISFVLAPVFAYLNYRAMTDSSIPKKYQQPPYLKRFGLIAIFLLVGFSIWFLLY